MEATGVYEKPIYNLLDGHVEVLVVNAQHIKQVPGRKTDINDAAWIASLLRHGLLRASFIPDRAQRELRELTRYRKSLVDERRAEVNRLQKTLEEANIKLAGVASDVVGASGRAAGAAGGRPDRPGPAGAVCPAEDAAQDPRVGTGARGERRPPSAVHDGPSVGTHRLPR
jgi:transposase